MNESLYQIISRVMDFPIEDLTDNSSPESIKSWDSFNGYVLLDELESNFDVKFSLDEVLDVKNISDIKKHLRNHGVKID